MAGLSRGRAPGPDALTTEMLRSAPWVVKRAIAWLWNERLKLPDRATRPEAWRRCLLFALKKHDNPAIVDRLPPDCTHSCRPERFHWRPTAGRGKENARGEIEAEVVPDCAYVYGFLEGGPDLCRGPPAGAPLASQTPLETCPADLHPQRRYLAGLRSYQARVLVGCLVGLRLRTFDGKSDCKRMEGSDRQSPDRQYPSDRFPVLQGRWTRQEGNPHTCGMH